MKFAALKTIFPAFFLVLFGAVCPAGAQSLPQSSHDLRVWQAEDGLPENKVVGVAQTPDGYLWVATPSGVVRFDGMRFQEVTPVNSAGLATSLIEVLLADREGRLWLAKDRGALVCIDGTQMRALTPADGLPRLETARAMAEDGDGGLWISYSQGSLVRIKDWQVKDFSKEPGLPAAPAGTASSLAADRDGRVWYAKNGRVGVFRDGKFQLQAGLPTRVVRLAPAWRGGIWLAAGQDVFHLNEGKAMVAVGKLPVSGASGEPSAIFEDKSGAVWVGTDSAGLFCCASNRVSRVETSHPAISCLAQDLEGDVWVGTQGGGLNRLRRRVATLFSSATGLPFDIVQSVCQDATGALWVAGQNGMLVRQQGDQWLVVPPGGMAMGNMTCVAADRRGGIYAGTWGGSLYHWQDGRFNSLNLPASFHRSTVHSLLCSSAGDLWFATGSAETLYRLRNQELKAFNLPAGYRRIRAMVEDAGGSIWAGASDGLLVRITGDRLVNETAAAGNLPIRCLSTATNGDLWIGYAGFGAGRLRAGQLARFGAGEGLPNSYISQIVPDGCGSIWFAGNHGIFQVREREFDEVAAGRIPRVLPVLYGRNEGVPNLQANLDFWPNALRGADGRLYFSMLTGLAEVQPDQVQVNNHPPQVAIERIIADDRAFMPGQDAAIALPPGLQHVRIEFSALSFIAPENVRFRYRLEGLDHGWMNADTQRAADYTHLPPGDYSFKVITCNNNGVWNETGAALALVVKPYFWETLWFKTLSVAAAGGVFSGVMILSLRWRHRRQIEQLKHGHALERERTRIAQDLHDDLGVGLTEIGLLGDLAGAPDAPPETSREYLRELTGRARNLVDSLDEIVWAINPANDTSLALSDFLSRYAQTLLNRAAIRCRLELVEPLPPAGLNAEQRHQLFLSFKEALNNIIRHAGASEVKVSLSAAEDGWLVRVTDNGHGFDGRPGGGSHDGLAGMCGRLQRLGGRCEINSKTGAGTSISLFVPLIRQSKP